MRVAIHQPEYLPCWALLVKLCAADVVVVLDDVQYSRGGLQNRARIADAEGAGHWLTVPVVAPFPSLIQDVRIAGDAWRGAHRAAVAEQYRRAPYYFAMQPIIEPLWAFPASHLGSVTDTSAQRLVSWICKGILGRQPPYFIYSHGMQIPQTLTKGARVLGICQYLAKTRTFEYLSGRGGMNYLNREAFRTAGIGLTVSSIEVPAYARPGAKPLASEELERISAIDALAYASPDEQAALAALQTLEPTP